MLNYLHMADIKKEDIKQELKEEKDLAKFKKHNCTKCVGDVCICNTKIKTGDTYSYKGWLNSDSFFKRAFSIFGYYTLASFIISIPFIILFLILGVTALKHFNTRYYDYDKGNMNFSNSEIDNRKLDINYVCNSALGQMSFKTKLESDKFLKDCKAGGRPEVIEKFKTDMGLDGARI